VVLLFDADAAGESAVDRSLEVFADADLDVRAASVEKGMDPCDYLVEHSAEEFLARIEAAADLFDAKLDFVSRKYPIETLAGRSRALDEVLATLALVSNAAKADLVLQRAAKRLGVDVEAARRQFRAVASRRRATSEDRQDRRPPAPLPRDEGGVIQAILAASELVPCALDRISPEEFLDPRARRIFEECVGLFDREGEIDPADLAARLQDRELAALVADLADGALERGQWERWLQDCLERMEQRRRQPQMADTRQRIAAAGVGADRSDLAAIQEHIRQRAARPRTPAPETR
jgi:DNA primase